MSGLNLLVNNPEKKPRMPSQKSPESEKKLLNNNPATRIPTTVDIAMIIANAA
jgi:hypothetical protein